MAGVDDILELGEHLGFVLVLPLLVSKFYLFLHLLQGLLKHIIEGAGKRDRVLLESTVLLAEIFECFFAVADDFG